MGRWLAVGAAASLVLPSSVSPGLTILTAQCDMSPLGPSRTSPAFSLLCAGGDQAMQRKP